MTGSADLRHTPLADLVVDDCKRPTKPDLGSVDKNALRAGRHLAAIHRHYLGDLARIKEVLQRVEAGDAPPAELAHIVIDAEMTKNLRAVGTICGQECGVLKMHHDIEEQSIFPLLHNRGTSQIKIIVERLQTEHLVVHELLERLGTAAQQLSNEPSDDAFQDTTAIFDQLLAVVKSHFKYEETTLEEALGVFGVNV
ncbi:hemerythrin domain-containing protein [Sulfitobacter noctilucicola]|uniref:Iron-sulfur cluster repair protein YtfE (RIC family) n=1 Tax=Sulfitobacter noctilucicola TaxID=1342301 RepID=A0A7W6M6X5_9RHOB|nr:hemerythrin domain-containing protein [Sulfitobacter noctilucicola]MBB4173232.1 iron-sulfur cluster repair protein YtfE (RIC family) [Sulfitobacter noctilucicola]